MIRHHKSLRNAAKGSLRLVWPVAYASNENHRRLEDTTKTAYFVEPQPSFKETPQIEFIRVLNTLGVISNPITRENFHTHTHNRVPPWNKMGFLGVEFMLVIFAVFMALGFLTT